MNRKQEIGIVGLGKFGLQLGTVLSDLGHIAIGIDVDTARVHAAQEFLDQVYEADATDKNALTQLKFNSLDTVVVSVGGGLESSILIVLNLQEIGVKNIVVKAASPSHKKVMQRLGVARIIQPEIDVATQTAYNLDNPGMLDLLPIGRGVMLQEVTVNKWAGKSLKDLNLRDVSDILVAAVREAGKKEYRFVPDPNVKLSDGDKLLMIGYKDAISKVMDKV